ncbi:hypothetical protein OF117_11035 [Geodermatophilus sp. YIM 151500]|uniref:hypothetical protein n=1 Tax=Geodermatophilus sp. YIM 151500 TaxID=2984531 RepID=UPI0021E40EF7|nr:hypothetical protein [Geodermatophilus sp. YIM 151500]MCV2489897.1 hypothetical protein [Geodermatophilus sp. YIM 151500]
MGWLTPQLATLMAALVALVGVGVTVLQKWRSDRRDAWWQRAQWAIDKSYSPDPDQREIGNRSMGVLNRDSFGIWDADREVLRIALRRSFEDAAASAAARERVAAGRSDAVQRARVAAAQSLIAVDDRLGRETDPEVYEVAGVDPEAPGATRPGLLRRITKARRGS